SDVCSSDLASLPRRGVCRRCPQRAVLVGLHLLRTPGSHLGLISPRTRKATAAIHRTQKKRVSFSRSLAYSICWDRLLFTVSFFIRVNSINALTYSLSEELHR